MDRDSPADDMAEGNDEFWEVRNMRMGLSSLLRLWSVFVKVASNI